MHDLDRVAPAFVEIAHRIVWATVATVTPEGRPRTRILHPYWEWDGSSLVGWIATSPQSPKRADLDATPAVSVTYWDDTQDTCTAECDTAWVLDDQGREDLWERFATAPAPVGYDPSVVPAWTEPTAATFAGLRLAPTRLRVMPGAVMLQGRGEPLSWHASSGRGA
ncbi:pyridoxamine 5'-phosphate oxidase family protein [Salsipaludibacter albus]|uniref:pyridoxamine 5'-phosphate oxidase family protein n=1 Tax=Salsipaludibacter albus TaxID=2849650 RepID=UPI001EE4B345|nr:pyridoxamine 5'-phosphate oxidase family protein [Salsipaludibacter albus]